MGWNYRIIKRKIDDNYCTHAIHEVYYDDNGWAHSWSTDPQWLSSDDGVDGLKADIDAMLEAFDSPVLDEEELLERQKVRAFLTTK